MTVTTPRLWLSIDRAKRPVRLDLDIDGVRHPISLDEAARFGTSPTWLTDQWLGTDTRRSLQDRAAGGDTDAAHELHEIEQAAAGLAESLNELQAISRHLTHRVEREDADG